MIKTNKGGITINGEAGEILADISIIAMHTKDAFADAEIPDADKLILKAVNDGLKGCEELGVIKTVKIDLDKTRKALKGLLEKLKDEFGG